MKPKAPVLEQRVIEAGSQQEFKRCLLQNVVTLRFANCGHVAILQYETVIHWGTAEPLADLLVKGWLNGYCGDCARRRGLPTWGV